MVDIDELMYTARAYCREFYQMEEDITIKITWQKKKFDVEIVDPFDRVIIKEDRIVMNYTVTNDDIVFVDMLKGLLVFHSPNMAKDSLSTWNFFTMVALILTPTSILEEGRKAKYVNQWIKHEEEATELTFEYKYGRWYRILSSYPRISVRELLQKFVKFYNPTIHWSQEIQLNQFLIMQEWRFINQRDLDILSYCLSHQRIDIKELTKQNSDLHQTSIYRVVQRLTMQIAEYYIPKYLSLGLSNMIICLPQHTADQLRKIKKHLYFQRIDSFKDKEEITINIILPSVKRFEIAQKLISEVPNILLFERFRATKTTLLRPDLYDFETGHWRNNGSKSEIKIQNKVEHNILQLSQKEVSLVKDIVQTRSEQSEKLSMRFSKSVTKKTIREIKQKELYYKQVLWRPPATFHHFSVLIPVSKSDIRPLMGDNWKNIEDVNWNLELFEKIIREEIDTLGLQFPVVSAELGLNLSNGLITPGMNFEQTRMIIFQLRISAPQEVIELIKLEYSRRIPTLHYWGQLQGPPGDMLQIPVDRFDDKEGWIFDIEKLIEGFST